MVAFLEIVVKEWNWHLASIKVELASCQYRGGNRQAIALNNYPISYIQVTLKIPDFLVATVINLDKPVEEVGDLVPECWVSLLVASIEILVKGVIMLHPTYLFVTISFG
ncbi:MAG: hypothetical protein F6K47_33350 [Symploca sp. SIO2E6]|nr:hypothetical protein [Symploca sp. SIO2E6]